MISDGIKVNFPALEQAAAALLAESTQIKGLLDEERGVLTSLGGAWEGAGADAWQDRQKRWQQDADDLNNVLSQLSKALNETVENHKKSEKANTEQWG